MNKSELITAVAQSTGLQKKEAEAAVNSVFASITNALKEGDKIQVLGFGTFEVRKRAARLARNPRRPDETIEVKAANVPAFKAGKALKEAVNG